MSGQSTWSKILSVSAVLIAIVLLYAGITNLTRHDDSADYELTTATVQSSKCSALSACETILAYTANGVATTTSFTGDSQYITGHKMQIWYNKTNPTQFSFIPSSPNRTMGWILTGCGLLILLLVLQIQVGSNL